MTSAPEYNEIGVLMRILKYFCAALVLSAACRCPGAVRAVIIGISKYDRLEVKPLQFAGADADEFDRYLRTGKAGPLDPRNISVLKDTAANRQQVLMRLSKALLNRPADDIVWLFLSARGMALPDGQDGYFGSSDLVEVKPESTGVSVTELKRMIEYSPARRVIILADLCRFPPASDVENRINIRFEELGASSGKIAGFVASDGQNKSLESKPRGLGVFGSSIVRALGQFHSGQPASPSSAVDFLRLLTQEVAKAAVEAGGRQTPRPLGKVGGAAPLWAMLEQTRSEGVLLASLRLLPGMLFQARVPAQSRVADLLGGTGEDPERIAADVNARRSAMPDADWTELRDNTAASLANRGQQLIAAYGVSDQLPNDPTRVGQHDRSFDVAARALRTARGLLPDTDVYRRYRQDLLGREKLCSGLHSIVTGSPIQARDDLREAAANALEPLPETENALGITFLEEGKRLPEAIRHFREAIALSPSWPYPRHNLALAYAESGDYAAAEREYLAAIQKVNGQPYLHFNLGTIYHRSGRRSAAKAQYAAALKALDETEKTYRRRADELKTVSPRAATLALDRANAVLTSRATVKNAQGALLEGERKYGPAAEAWVEATQIDPMLCAARHNLAVMKQRLGDKKLASVTSQPEELFRTNLRYCPDFHPSRTELGMLKLYSGDLPTARSEFAAVLRSVPANVEARKGLAIVQVRTGEIEAARPVLAELAGTAAAGLPDAEVLEALGDLYRSAKDSRACESYKAAVAATKVSRYRGDLAGLKRKATSCSARQGSA